MPAQYTPDKPACVYVNQDGVQWNAPVVFDNLIHKKEMPVTIGVFVIHGRVRAANAESGLDRFNRSFEYDGLGDNYARFLLDELLPDVRDEGPRTDGLFAYQRTETTAPSVGRRPERFALSPPPGSVPTPFHASSAPSELT